MRVIAQISDLHFGRHDRKIAQDLLESLDRDRPDLVAASGDFTQRAQPSEFREAAAFLESIAAPKLVVPGNHDVPLLDLVSRFRAPLARYNRFIPPAAMADALYRDEEIVMLGLNTTRRLLNKRGRISLAQIEHLRHTFRNVPQPVLKAVVTHHPLASPADQPRLKLALRADAAVAELVSLDVHLLLSGHRHRAVSGHLDVEITAQGTILVIHAGTAISTRTRAGEANSYNLIRVDGSRVSVEIKLWQGGRGFHTAHHISYDLRGSVWRSL